VTVKKKITIGPGKTVAVSIGIKRTAGVETPGSDGEPSVTQPMPAKVGLGTGESFRAAGWGSAGWPTVPRGTPPRRAGRNRRR
jgi:hypothetical protein